MEVYINNQPVVFLDTISLRAVLSQQHLLEKKGIAVAVNNAVIPKPDWASYTLHPADKITIIQATQGG